jgi:hypothetical protein
VLVGIETCPAPFPLLLGFVHAAGTVRVSTDPLGRSPAFAVKVKVKAFSVLDAGAVFGPTVIVPEPFPAYTLKLLLVAPVSPGLLAASV